MMTTGARRFPCFVVASLAFPFFATLAFQAKGASSSDPFENSNVVAKPAPTAKTAPMPGASTPTPAAQKNTGPVPYVPSKEFEAFMKAFEGNWKCETQFAAGTLWPGSQPVTSKTEVTIRKEFDGFMWHGEFKMAKTAATTTTSGVFQIGYAAPSKQVTYLSYDSMGSSMMGVGTISGTQITFLEEGFVKGVKVKVRETLAKQGPRKLYHKVEFDHGKGYQPMSEDTCVK